MRERKVFRDSTTGKFVSVESLTRRPDTTTTDTLLIKRKGGWRRGR